MPQPKPSPFQRLLHAITRAKPPAPKQKIPIDPDLLATVQRAALAQGVTTNQLASDLITERLNQIKTEERSRQAWATLSRRERETCAMICAGYTSQQIAAEMGVKIVTVRTFLSHTYRKFHVSNSDELSHLLKDWDFSDFF